MVGKSLFVVALTVLGLTGAAWADPPTYTDPSSGPSNDFPAEAPARKPAITFGDQALPPPQQAYVPRQYAQPAPQPLPFRPRQPRYFGIMAGVNIGLFAVDLHVSHFYMYAGAGMGVTLLSNMRFGAFTGGAGYALQIARFRTADWFMDMMVMGGGGWQDVLYPTAYVRYGYGAVGLGIGFRYEHASGFSLGFKIPLFGYAFGNHVRNSATGVGLYYLNALAGLPIVSLGYRF